MYLIKQHITETKKFTGSMESEDTSSNRTGVGG